MQNLVNSIKNGKAFSFSFSEYAAQAHFSHKIHFDRAASLFQLETTEKDISGNEYQSFSSLDEQSLLTFLQQHSAYFNV